MRVHHFWYWGTVQKVLVVRHDHFSGVAHASFLNQVNNNNLAIANRSRVSCINTNNNTMTLKSGLLYQYRASPAVCWRAIKIGENHCMLNLEGTVIISVCVSVCLSVCLSVCMYVRMSISKVTDEFEHNHVDFLYRRKWLNIWTDLHPWSLIEDRF